MNQNFFNFPTSWVAEMNKQAQPKVAAILRGVDQPAMLMVSTPTSVEIITEGSEQSPTPTKHKGRPAGSKNKPKASTVRKVDNK